MGWRRDGAHRGPCGRVAGAHEGLDHGAVGIQQQVSGDIDAAVLHEAVGVPGGHEGHFCGAVESDADPHLQGSHELAQHAHTEGRLHGVGEGAPYGVGVDDGKGRRERRREEHVQFGDGPLEGRRQRRGLVEPS